MGGHGPSGARGGCVALWPRAARAVPARLVRGPPRVLHPGLLVSTVCMTSRAVSPASVALVAAATIAFQVCGPSHGGEHKDSADPLASVLPKQSLPVCS